MPFSIAIQSNKVTSWGALKNWEIFRGFFPQNLFILPKLFDLSQGRIAARLTYPSLLVTWSIQRQYLLQRLEKSLSRSLCKLVIFGLPEKHVMPKFAWYNCFLNISHNVWFGSPIFSFVSWVQLKIVNRSRPHRVPCWLELITELQQRDRLRKSKMEIQVIFLLYKVGVGGGAESYQLSVPNIFYMYTHRSNPRYTWVW